MMQRILNNHIFLLLLQIVLFFVSAYLYHSASILKYLFLLDWLVVAGDVLTIDDSVEDELQELELPAQFNKFFNTTACVIDVGEREIDKN